MEETGKLDELNKILLDGIIHSGDKGISSYELSKDIDRHYSTINLRCFQLHARGHITSTLESGLAIRRKRLWKFKK